MLVIVFLPENGHFNLEQRYLIGFSHTTVNVTPPRLPALLGKAKMAYRLWYEYYQLLPKLHRHTLGQRIDSLFVEVIETIASASFLAREDKAPYVRLAIRKVDVLKVLLMVLWETKSIDNKKYAALSVKVEDIGKMLGGWIGQLTKTQPR